MTGEPSICRAHIDIVVLSLTFLLLGACGGDEDQAPAPPLPPGNVLHLLPMTGTTIGVGQSQLTYAEHDSGPGSRPLRLNGHDLQWSSSRPDVAAVDLAGVVTAHATGETEIIARFGDLAQSSTLRVAGTFATYTLAVPGQGTRRYALWSPGASSGAEPRPLLLALHGAGGTPSIQASMTLLNTLAAREDLLVAYLEGSGFVPTFNAGGCCGYAQSANIDDVAYVAAVIDDVAARAAVDRSRVYATGFSNGAMMAHRLACSMADRLAGIVAVSGTPVRRDLSGAVYYDCAPARPIPVLHVHATNDRIVPFGGGASAELPGPRFLPVRDAIADLFARNNVTAEALSSALTPTTTCHRYETPIDPSRHSAPVELCELDPVDVYDPALGVVYGGGHSWPGGVPSPAAGSDIPVQDFEVNERLWDFLSEDHVPGPAGSSGDDAPQ